ncbi:MAG TPA: MG2 domain-containing protein [Chthoniobacterales bacterium]|nr:MG2 domain-containing protein [Chthoniobacterales bacterium]
MFQNARVFFGTLIACGLIPAALAADKDVELLTDAEFLQPTSTLEFRFASPVAVKDDVGTVPTVAPIEIKPALAGTFTWLSQRSGVFVPSGPPHLGTEFLVTIRPGFQDLSGHPVGQAFQAVVKTPAYEVTRAVVFEEEAGSPKPEIRLALNLDTQLDPHLFRFTTPTGESVPADVRYAKARDYFQVAPELLDWNRRWQGRNQSEPETLEEEQEKPQPDRLIVTPQETLDAGRQWRLEIAPGLKSISGTEATIKPKVVNIGAITPFTVKNVSTANYIHSGKTVTVEFSRELAPDITAESANRLLQIEPAVDHLSYENDNAQIRISGAFGLGQTYQIKFSPELVDKFGLPMEGERSQSFQFTPVKPRVYLPVTSGDQFRNGNRQFEVLSVNVQRLRVRAVLVDPVNGPTAKKAFAAYDHDEEGSRDPDEPNRRIPDDKIRGKVIYDRAVKLNGAQVDVQLKTQLNWSEIVGADRGGMVLLTIDGEPISGIGDRQVGAQALIQVTDIGVFWTRESDKLRLSLFSLSSGAALPAAEILLLDDNRAQISRTSSDATGSATVPFTPGIAWLVVRRSDDAYALQLGKEANVLPAAGFNLQIYYPPWDAEAVPENTRSFVFTDRPLYRPGETVHVRGLVRTLKRSGLEGAKGLKGQLTVLDPQGETASSSEIMTDSQGAFQTEIPLKPTALGRQSIRITFGDEESEESSGSAFVNFEVADYEPNAFELDLKVPERLTPAMPARAEVSGKYLFGAPLTRAQVRWTLQSTPSIFAPAGFENFQFAAEDPQPKTTTITGSGSYDGTRPLVVEPELPKANGKVMQSVLTVDMTDLNQQTVTESRVFQKDPAAFYLGIARPENSVIRAGTRVPIRCIAVTPEGKPLDRLVDVQIEVIQKRHQTVRVKGAGKSVSFRTTDLDETIGQTRGQTLTPALIASQWSIPESKTAEIDLPTAGEYLVRANSQDPDGRSVMSEVTLYVEGENEVAWDFRNAAQIDLVPDKAEYHPGETARVLVKSPYSGEAILNVARGTEILRSQRLTLNGNTPTVEVPVLATDAPNIYVSVILIRGSTASTRRIKVPEFRYGITNLSVVDPATKLRIAITPSKPAFEPGEPVDIDLEIKDGFDHPVPNSEVTFFAVDDGVLALTGYQRPDPHTTFFKTFPLNVGMGLTLDSLLAEDPQDLQYTNKGYLIGGGGLDIPGAKLRTDFPGTAYWNPSVRTDATGHTKVQFTSPDAITRYRLVAVAFCGNSQFGSAESSVTIRKPLLILPSMARFTRSGDRLGARAIVRNETDHEENVRVQLILDERITAAQPTTTSFSLPSGSARTVDFPIQANHPGTSHWQWLARSDDHADRVGASIEIHPAGPTLRETYLSDLTDKRADLLAGTNPQLLEGQGSLSVTLSNTRLTSLREAIVTLRSYPYQCTEQLASGLVPLLVRDQLKSALPSQISDTGGQVIDAAKTLSLLFSRQTGSGGLSLWPRGEQPALFASAYAAWVIAGLQRDGVQVPAEKWKHLLDYLSQSLRGLAKIHDELRLNEEAFVLLALAAAGQAEPSYYEQLISRKAELSRETRAILALAILAGNGATRSVVDSLLDAKAAAPESESLYGGSARENALLLLAWTRYKPRSPEVGPLVKELLAARHYGRWETTQENAWALLALANYYRSTESGGKSVTGTLLTADQSLSFEVTRQKPSWTTSLPLDPAKPLHDLTIRHDGIGSLFSEAQFEVYPAVTEQPRQDRGYAVTRFYQKLGDDGKLQPAETFKVGDRILVTLNVKSSRPGRLVAIDDPIPSVFEAINPDFKLEEEGADSPSGDQYYADYREIHGDRVQFFCDQLRAGDYTFRYLSRVRFAGEATVPPTKVVEMYRPARFGLGATAKITSTATDHE